MNNVLSKLRVTLHKDQSLANKNANRLLLQRNSSRTDYTKEEKYWQTGRKVDRGKAAYENYTLKFTFRQQQPPYSSHHTSSTYWAQPFFKAGFPQHKEASTVTNRPLQLVRKTWLMKHILLSLKGSLPQPHGPNQSSEPPVHGVLSAPNVDCRKKKHKGAKSSFAKTLCK